MLNPLFGQEPEALGLVYHLEEGPLEATPKDLLAGYRELRAISFSASFRGLAELLSGFEEVELLLSLEEGYDEARALAALNEEAEALLPLLGQKRRFEVHFLSKSHAKLYLLRGPKGQRTILGSLNLSRAAWSGAQSEVVVVSDDPGVYATFAEWYEGEKARAKPALDGRARRKVLGERGELLVAPAALPPQEVKKLTARLKGVVVFNLVGQRPLVDRSKAQAERTLSALRELAKEVEEAEALARLKGQEKALEAYLKRAAERALENTPRFQVQGEAVYYQGLPLKEFTPNPDGLEATLEVLSALLEGARKGSPLLAEAVGEALVYGLAASYLPLLRRQAVEEGLDPARYPIVALLVGRAGAGKTTALRTIAALWGLTHLHYGQVEETGRSKGTTIENHLYLEESAPLLIDEIPPRHLTEGVRLAQTIKGVGDDPRVNRALILTSNLEHFRSEEQILRRAWFIPFEFLPKKDVHLGSKLRRITQDLLLRFLQEAFPGLETLKALLLDKDPLRPAREFLLGLGLPVPQAPKGEYATHLLQRWRTLYLAQPEIFQEVRAPDASTGVPIPCFVVDKEKAGFLVPLQPFDNGFAGNQQAYLLKKRAFLEAIGVREKRRFLFWG
ncbi:hypothetical protein GCM10007092_15380 [Thermus composti]|uniref:Phospholipase D-like domain-containing protein n=1 Tax=Thermus composti TaxID=532059 RepID=A0ABV6Q009_9DEIN|nr:phospholipase D-like domain-containing protein [Thermus composti]GGN02046.1 hypothetical protein GCM10007092_15380 [Thermus composti]